jgi:hypothetical protein
MPSRVRSQLAIQAPPELLARLRSAATAQGRTTTSVCIEALENWLNRAGAAPPSADLAQRVAALEERVRVLAPSLSLAASPQTLLPPDEIETLTTSELSARTGTNRAAWNQWAAAHSTGDVRVHSKAGHWRLVGKTASEGGGPPRWMWERVG